MKKFNSVVLTCLMMTAPIVFMACGSDDDDDDSSSKKEQSQQTVTECPDSNHPHMIDLGLPSGTKWACCNVGASAPEEYGDYYAWGEVQTKSDYTMGNYAYYKDNSYVNIGSDIAGTSYDAASANLGAPWCMPTLEQCEELLNNCSKEWTSLNGVNGEKFKGANGSTIFLPAAGRYSNEGGGYMGTRGYYRLSTFYEDNQERAYVLVFQGSIAAIDKKERHRGYPIRPVRKD